jgi:hypothetical protein
MTIATDSGVVLPRPCRLANKRMQQTARLGFKRKAIAVMRLITSVTRPASLSWTGSTPQLMRRAVRLRTAADRGRSPLLIRILTVAMIVVVGAECDSPMAPEARAPDFAGIVLAVNAGSSTHLLVQRESGEAVVWIVDETRFYNKAPGGRVQSTDLQAIAIGDSAEVWTTGVELRSLPPQYYATQLVAW